MSEGRQLPSDIGRLWRESTPSQRLGLGAFLLICVGLLALVAGIARRPHFAVLYANLQPEDAAQVVKRLRDLKAPYRVAGAGTVEAPADRIDELRLDLAGEALPAGGQTGFELFDRTRLGLSDFGEQLNYQRALQGELARTIAHLDSVENARVHVSLPRERLYAGEQEKPTASVVLKLRGGSQLTSAQVGSITHLVSGAVGGLTPEGVTLLDTRGRLLSNPDAGADGVGMALASSQLQLRREYERDVEQAVQTMLDGVVGVGKAMVRASATLDFDRVETERETYEPTDAGNGVLESRRETRETYRGLADPSAIGIPGVSSNAPPKPAPATGNPRADQYERSELTAEYRVSRSVQRTLRPPGQLKRLSVAVFVDEAASVDDVEDLKTAIVAAAGLDVDRGDSVAISQVPFEPPAPAEKGSKAFAIRDFYFTVGKDLAAIVLAVIFLRFLAGMVRGRRRTGAESAPAPAPAVRPQPASDPRAPATPQSVVPEAAFDAESAAGVLRQWLSPEVASGDDGDGVKAGTRA